MDDNLQDFKESMNAWGWSVNARNNFNKFMDAIETEQGLIEQIQRIQSIIDDIVLNKEISQFKRWGQNIIEQELLIQRMMMI